MSKWPPGVPIPPTDDETNALDALIRAAIANSIVSGFHLEFGEDSNGERAVWIYLRVDSKQKWSKQDEAEVYRVTSTIRNGIIQSKIGYWPYVDVEEVELDGSVH